MEISAETHVRNAEYRVVFVGQHPILTVVTHSPVTAKTWIKEATAVHNSKSLPNTVLVGFSAERQRQRQRQRQRDQCLPDAQCDTLHFCVGYNSLVYHLPEPSIHNNVRFLNRFLSHPKVVLAGRDMKETLRNLWSNFGVRPKKPVDLNELIGMKREDLYSSSYYLDKLTRAVLAGEDEPAAKKPKCFSTEAYLCFKLFDMIQLGAEVPKEKLVQTKKDKKRKKNKIPKKKKRKNNNKQKRWLYEDFTVV